MPSLKSVDPIVMSVHEVVVWEEGLENAEVKEAKGWIVLEQCLWLGPDKWQLLGCPLQTWLNLHIIKLRLRQSKAYMREKVKSDLKHLCTEGSHL